MTMPKTILLPTNFRGRCDRPRARAIQLARELGARLIIFHVLPECATGAGVSVEEDVAQAEARLRVEVQPRNIHTITRLALGSVVQEILRAATQDAADLIVMGISRYDEIGDLVVGTTLKRVVRYGSIPTLVVKMLTGPHHSNLPVGTDFSDRNCHGIEGTLDPLSGRGLYPTFKIDAPLMSWRLDHIFATPAIRVVAFVRPPHVGSDHYPVLATLCHRATSETPGLEAAPGDAQ